MVFSMILAVWPPISAMTPSRIDLSRLGTLARLSDDHCSLTHPRNPQPSFQLAMSGRCQLFIYEFDRQWTVLRKQVHAIEDYYYCTCSFQYVTPRLTIGWDQPTISGHDFLLTEHWYIFHHTPFYKLSKSNVAKIISGASAPGQLMHYYPGE